jgi:hypothetical protein
MPVRSLSSPILKWPDRDTVHEAARRWATDTVARRPDILRIGYFGSYADGRWGVGSDLDLVIVVESSDLPPHDRPSGFPASALPVPYDILVYTQEEWECRIGQDDRFARTLREETVWLVERERVPAGRQGEPHGG